MKKILIVFTLLLLCINLAQASVWNSSFEQGLTRYYNMGSATESLHGTLSLYNGSSEQPVYTLSNCLIGGCVQTNQSRDVILPRWYDTDMMTVSNASNFTINFWAKAKTLSNPESAVFFAPVDGATLMSGGTHMNWLPDASISIGNEFTEGGVISKQSALDKWVMVTYVIMYNGGPFTYVYINGTLVGSGTRGNFPGGNWNLDFGSATPTNPDFYFDGYFDEVGIWNRTLSSFEVSALYNSGVGIGYYPNAPPNITVYFPNGTIPYAYLGQNLTVNITASDDNLDKCWINYNGTNRFIPCGGNSSIILTTQKNLTAYANDTNGNLASKFVSWDYNVFENSIVYNNPSYETKQETYILNYTRQSNILSSSAVMYYNSTAYPSTVSCVGTSCSITNTLDIPLIVSGTQANYTFYWVITTFDGISSYISTSSTSTQTVNQLTLTKCTTGTISMNFTSWDEQNLTRINPFLFDATFNYYIGSGSIYKTLNISNSTGAEIDLCINQNTTYYIDSIIAFSAPNNPTAYTLRNYFFQRWPINNTRQDIGLYLLKSASSTSFVLSVIDENALPMNGVLVNSQKCYPGTNTNTTMFIARTNNLGLTVGNFEAETALYQFFITNQSQTLLAVTPCMNVIPQTAPYTLTFQLGAAYDSPFNDILNITDMTESIIFNSTSNNVTLTYIDTSGHLSRAELIVRAMNFSGNTNPIVCNVSSDLSSGILSCHLTNSGTYTATAYLYRSPGRLMDQIVVVVQTVTGIMSYYGAFLGWFIILVCAFAFKFNELAGIWLVNAAVWVTNAIGLITFGWTGVLSILAISIVITAVLNR